MGSSQRSAKGLPPSTSNHQIQGLHAERKEGLDRSHSATQRHLEETKFLNPSKLERVPSNMEVKGPVGQRSFGRTTTPQWARSFDTNKGKGVYKDQIASHSIENRPYCAVGKVKLSYQTIDRAPLQRPVKQDESSDRSQVLERSESLEQWVQVQGIPHDPNPLVNAGREVKEEQHAT